MSESRKRKFTLNGLIKRFGVAGFLFFLIKGLLWIIVPTLLGYFGYATMQ
jgi:hypothetical protein